MTLPVSPATPQSVTRDFLEQRKARLDQQVSATALKLSQMQQQLAAYQGARAEITDMISQLPPEPTPETPAQQ